MNKKTKFISDFTKIATDTLGTISGIKKEIETIVKIRIEKFINKADLVKRNEFEVLKLRVDKLSKNVDELKKSSKLYVLKSKKKSKKHNK